VRRTGLVLWHKPNSVPAFARWRSFISLGFPSAQHYYRVLVALCLFLKPDNSAGCDYYPRVSSRIRGKSGQATLPLLCLAPHGVFRAAPLTRMSGGLLPRLFTLTQHHFGSDGALESELLGRAKSGAGRYIFCDTVRHPGFRSWAPPISRGMLPFGVRTFLWQNKCQASDHPPQGRLTQSESGCQCRFRRRSRASLAAIL
jgi:hypothetical protein